MKTVSLISSKIRKSSARPTSTYSTSWIVLPPVEQKTQFESGEVHLAFVVLKDRDSLPIVFEDRDSPH